MGGPKWGIGKGGTKTGSGQLLYPVNKGKVTVRWEPRKGDFARWEG